MAANIALTTTRQCQSQKELSCWPHIAREMALFKIDKSRIFSFMAKQLSPKKLKTEQPRSTVKEYSFFADVYDVVRQVPKGRVTSYGAIAAYLGTKLSARMVGWAMNAAHVAKPKVPAHRVVNRNGMLTGKHHFGTPTLMEELLLKEKIKVKEDTIIDFKTHFWDPVTELGM